MNLRVVKEKLYKALNRPGLRFLLASAVSTYSSLKAQRVCRVYYEEKREMWIQEFPHGVLVEPHVRLRALSQIERNVNDMFLFEYTLKPGDVVLDIGAGTGWETLCFSRLVGPAGHVLSVEAHPRTFACLSEMCRRNQLPNVTLIHGAATGDGGQVMISDKDHHTANSIVDAPGDIVVQAVSIRSLIESAGLGRVDFLKMNIEGAERPALVGMKEVIHRIRHLCISCHDFLADRGSSKMMRTSPWVINFLEENGFKLFRRANDPRPWIRDCVYAHNCQFDSLQSTGPSELESECLPELADELQTDRAFDRKENF